MDGIFSVKIKQKIPSFCHSTWQVLIIIRYGQQEQLIGQTSCLLRVLLKQATSYSCGFETPFVTFFDMRTLVLLAYAKLSNNHHHSTHGLLRHTLSPCDILIYAHHLGIEHGGPRNILYQQLGAWSSSHDCYGRVCSIDRRLGQHPNCNDGLIQASQKLFVQLSSS
jgi:hypothetical protein